MKTFIAAITVSLVVLLIARIIVVIKTTRKCTCGNHNDKADKICTNCKCSLN